MVSNTSRHYVSQPSQSTSLPVLIESNVNVGVPGCLGALSYNASSAYTVRISTSLCPLAGESGA